MTERYPTMDDLAAIWVRGPGGSLSMKVDRGATKWVRGLDGSWYPPGTVPRMNNTVPVIVLGGWRGVALGSGHRYGYPRVPLNGGAYHVGPGHRAWALWLVLQRPTSPDMGDFWAALDMMEAGRFHEPQDPATLRPDPAIFVYLAAVQRGQMRML